MATERNKTASFPQTHRPKHQGKGEETSEMKSRRSALHLQVFFLTLLWLRHLERLQQASDRSAQVLTFSQLTGSATNAASASWFEVDPDFGLNVVQIVTKRGFAIEEHHVTTQDGYILTLFRLPKNYEESQSPRASQNEHRYGNQSKPVVLLMHGLLDSSYTWVANYRDQSLAFVLADAGYDVWLGNNRGTTWSQKHVQFSAKDPEFWDFSWVQLAQYDFPALMHYVLNHTTRPTISYVGHSEGSMQAFVAFAQDQELAKRVSFFAALGPVAFLGFEETPWLVELSFVTLRKFANYFPFGAYLPRSQAIAKYASRYVCTPFSQLCQFVVDSVAGKSAYSNVTRLPVYLTQTPAGSSIKNMLHFAQLMVTKSFRNYDYGCNCLHPDDDVNEDDHDDDDDQCPIDQCANKAKYGTVQPPSYDLTALRYPRLGFIEGTQDSLAGPKNVEQTRSSLPNGTIVYQRQLPLNHVEFTWSPFARELFYDEMIQVMQTFEGQGY